MISAALDTTQFPTLAVQREDTLIAEECLGTGGRHSDQTLVPWLRDALKKVAIRPEAVQQWTVGTGPGSFSGVRVGIALVQGICAVSGSRCRGIPTSVALARAAIADDDPSPRGISVLNDGRRGQWILSRYHWDGKHLTSRGAAEVIDPHQLDEKTLPEDILVTSQPEAVRERMPKRCLSRLVERPHPEARYLLSPPGWSWPDTVTETMASLEPVYVRPAVFVPPRAPRRES